MAENVSIPGPVPLPILGNLLNINLKSTLQSFLDLASTYGPIYKLRLGGTDRIFISDYDLANELCSRKDFVKVPIGVVRSQKDVMPEGLVTADPGQESWELAHRILVPSFGPLSIRNMFDEMHDTISQLVLKWARFGDDTPIDVTADFTRLTLDTIALCAMGTRFNLLYTDKTHPFVDAMMATLGESQKRSVRPSWLSSIFWRANQSFEENSRILHQIAGQGITRRRNCPSDRNDLLDAMLHGRDPVTGKQLSDQVVMDNVIAFLVAGHETTSNLLSFLFISLLLNPKVYRKLQKEVDTVLQSRPLTPDHLNKLPYTKACLKETLRLYPPVAALGISYLGDSPTTLGNKWVIQPNDPCVILLPKIHQDPKIFGLDVADFKPERMLEENVAKLPPNSFKPFGHGMRACIGSEFAMQESIMAVALLIQKFDFKFVDPEWKLTTKQVGTVKPCDLFIHAKLRTGVNMLALQRDLFHGSSVNLVRTPVRRHPGEETTEKRKGERKVLRPMFIFFGSNTGTCQDLAERLAVSALQRGFNCTARSLDNAVDVLPQGHPVIIISSTHYEGQPPDNAAKFVTWITSQESGSLDGVNYAVFGCGNRDWKETFQAIPTRLDHSMRERGAQPIATRGVADVSEGNIFGDFDTWQEDQLWPRIEKIYGNQPVDNDLLGVVESTKFPGDNYETDLATMIVSRQIQAKVKEVRALTTTENRPKFHVEIELPEGTTYEVGDYLEVYPRNSEHDITKLRKVIMTQGYDEPERLAALVGSNHELNHPATAKQIETLIQSCSNAQEKSALESTRGNLINLNSPPKIRQSSILDLLTTHQHITLPSKTHLTTLLKPLRPRLYSISSSPSPTTKTSSCTLTYSLHPAGLTSNYLTTLQPGSDTLPCTVRPGNARFRPPEDPFSTPVIMICAGSGIAPFRGFVAHRAELMRRDPGKRLLRPAVLYVGCRGPGFRLYEEEFESWMRGGVVDVRYAFSRLSLGGGDGKDDDKDGFPGYVQDRVYAERVELARLWDQGARVYVCGSRDVSQGVKEVVRKIYREVAAEQGCRAKTETEVEEWRVGILRERYAVDVF